MEHKIFLTYCHEIVGIAMKWLVQKHFPFSAISEAQNFQTALNALPTKHYDLVVLDTEIGGSTNVLGIVQHIKAISPETRILIFSELDEVIYGPKYLAFGTNGYLDKKADIGSIILAIKTVLRGEIFLSRQQEKFSGEKNEIRTDSPFDKLSNREAQIVEALVEGVTLIEIGRKMNLKETTVSTYKKRIFDKIGVKNLSDLIAIRQIYH